MPPYPVLCLTPGCGKPAAYKVAARWSDGVFEELKTYGLACAEHLDFWRQRAMASQAACRLSAGETLEPPQVYEFVPSVRSTDSSSRSMANGLRM